MFCCVIRKIFKNNFFHRTSPVAGFVFSETKKLKWKNIFTLIYSEGNASDSALFSIVAGLRAYSFTKKGLHLRCF